LEETEELLMPIHYPEQLFLGKLMMLLDQDRSDGVCTGWKRNRLGSCFFWLYFCSEDGQG
jgi:hypothetical protein